MQKTLHLVLLLVLATASFSVLAQTSELRRAYRHIESERYDKAIVLLKSTLEKYPDNADVWYEYGRALQKDNQLKRAEEVWHKVVAFPGYQAFANFQLALVYGEQSKLDASRKHFELARDAGYLNIDRFKDEPGLKMLREQGLIEFPAPNEYRILKARNRLTVPYQVVLPENYDASMTYQGLVAFSPGNGGRASADWAIEKLWSGENSDWIIVVPVVPEPEGRWMSHPSHHALNDLMDHIRSEYNIRDNRFHVLGFHSGGGPAATFSLMSKDYFKSVTTVGAWNWDDWEDKDLKDFRPMPVNLIVADGEPYIRQINQHARDVMLEAGAKVRYIELSGQGQQLSMVYGNKLLSYLQQ